MPMECLTSPPLPATARGGGSEITDQSGIIRKATGAYRQPTARPAEPLRATGNRDAASRGWGTHLTALSSVATQHQGDSLRRLAMHAPQPRSLIHAPIAGRSKRGKP